MNGLLDMPTISFDNSYARLPDRFFARLAPTPVAAPRLVAVNEPLAQDLGLDVAALSAEMLAGNSIMKGSEPLAMAYAGHQFGNFVPQLGDGRALLLGEVLNSDGERFDLQLKGAGKTPFSRGGDGRAWLGPVLREYIVSEAMAALKIPTTRALAAVETGEQVVREAMLPGAVLTRVARSHIRVGTFQYFAVRDDTDALRKLADYTIERLWPELATRENPYLGLLEQVARAQAALIAQWMRVGFIHGVMNTDNMSVAGETIDYGPCAFMDAFDPAKVFSSIDQMGRYAFQNQPGIAHWNLAVFAQSLLPLIDADQEVAVAKAQAMIDQFPDWHKENWRRVMAKKLGVSPSEASDALMQKLLTAMADNRVDFTLLFRALARLDHEAARGLFVDPAAYNAWVAEWLPMFEAEGAEREERVAEMQSASPALIPRNHRVEEVIAAAVAGDFGPFERLNAALARPYEDRAEFSDLAASPSAEQEVTATFCGT